MNVWVCTYIVKTLVIIVPVKSVDPSPFVFSDCARCITRLRWQIIYY